MGGLTVSWVPSIQECLELWLLIEFSRKIVLYSYASLACSVMRDSAVLRNQVELLAANSVRTVTAMASGASESGEGKEQGFVDTALGLGMTPGAAQERRR